MSVLKIVSNFILDLFFPKICLNCHKEGSWICGDCLKEIEVFDAFSCPICKKRLPEANICKNCKRETELTRFFAATSYENPLVKELIQRFKYDYLKELAKPLSKFLINFLKIIPSNSDFLIIPVPLHDKRQRKRGFNQAEEIARELSIALKIPMISNFLLRVKDIPAQVEIKDFNQRKENVKNAFSLKNPEIFRGKKIILVDDVYTTGSTMEECAKVLKQAGATEIWGVVVAKG